MNPWVLSGLAVGVVLLVAFCFIETKIPDPMFQMRLFKIRAFAFGNLASLLGAIARGGLQFMLVIWLAGIWLPLHGYNYVDTPLWAGIYMLPLTAGFLIAGPISGWLSDRYGQRLFATAGLLVATAAFIGLMLLPIVFPYWLFGTLIFFNGVGSGLFASPNTSAIMSAVPANQRGSASGMRSTFQNSGMSLSIGIFFSLMVAGLAATLPKTLTAGLTGQGVPLDVASKVAHLPPVSTMFAALLGFNPVHNLLAPTGVLTKLNAHQVGVLTGKSFFPHVISAPFHHGLVIVFTAAAIMSFVGAMVSLLRGKQYYYEEPGTALAPVSTAVNGPSGSQPSIINGNGHHANGHPVSGNGVNGHAASGDGDNASAGGAARDGAARDGAARPAPGGRG
jgi:MFS family permease